MTRTVGVSSTTVPRSHPTPRAASRVMRRSSRCWSDSLGKPVMVGKKTQAIPTRVKRAVRARDRGCRFPGCGQRQFTDVHHIRWRSRGGSNRLANLAELCWHHHWLVHEGGWGLVAEPDGELVAIQPNGEPLALRSVTDRSRRRERRSPQHRSGCRHRARHVYPALVRRSPRPRPHHHQPHAAMGMGTPRSRARPRDRTRRLTSWVRSSARCSTR